MKKILLALIAMVACTAVNAKVVKITMKDNITKVYTSSQISAIDFNDDGSIMVTSYDNKVLDVLTGEIVDVTVSDEEAITEVKSITMEFNPMLVVALSNGEDLASIEGTTPISTRAAHQINFVYPSTDPYGDPVTLSGAIWVPDNIWNAEDDSEGIVLFNHFTTTSPNLLPSNGAAYLESWFLANPLMPDYIVVESDFYGLGATERFPLAYQQGDVNGHASVDALLAARRILGKLSIKTGILNFNVGYSGGGFDALATQRVRDMEFPHNYDVCFDKTFAGGSSSDMKICYEDIVRIGTFSFSAAAPILFVATNETQKLGLDYADVFQEYIAAHIDDWFLSKEYSPFELSAMIGKDKKIKDILTAPYLDLESAESKFMQDVYEKISLNNGWTANPSQRVYIYHSRKDDMVPVQSGRALLKHLKDYGYEPSIIPGATNLQTNFVMPIGHMAGVLPWFVQTTAAILAWPTMYYEGELNENYKFLVEQTKDDPIAILRNFESIGFDCRGMIKQLLALNPNLSAEDIDEATLEAELGAICQQQLDVTYDELCEMMEDSGIDIRTFIIELVRYIDENPSQDIFKADIRTLRSSNDKVNPVEENENLLYDWLEANGVK